jgi:FAD synthetase
VNDFTNAVAEKYGLRMVFLQNTDFKAALRQCVNDYHTKAVFIGTRNTDPYCGHLSFFCRTDVDKGWPDLIRINPILRWSYADVWDYLRQDVSRTYCSLYDAGYTSIGRIDNTTRNQALLCEDGSFRPAYALQDGSQERDGRFSAKR